MATGDILPPTFDAADPRQRLFRSYKFISDRIHEAEQAGRPIDDDFIAEVTAGYLQFGEIAFGGVGEAPTPESAAATVRDTVELYRTATGGS